MKRMSEVFELPVAVGGGMFDKDTIYGADGNGEWIATFETDEQAKLTALAVNHVDALVDALQKLLDDACDNYDMENRKSVYNAKKALAAYRGDK